MRDPRRVEYSAKQKFSKSDTDTSGVGSQRGWIVCIVLRRKREREKRETNLIRGAHKEMERMDLDGRSTFH